MRPAQEADYGIDAPGLRRSLLTLGIGGGVGAGLAAAGSLCARGLVSAASSSAAVVAGFAAVYGLGMAAHMTLGSRVGKLRTRERLLDLAHGVVPWTGRETVLDVGCGRGLMLVAAARRLTAGTAIGIDLWRSEDQSANTAEAALENARCENVADRVSVATADARALPFADACFDMVLSHWVVHNLPNATDRTRVLKEMLRVLKSGGALVLADIAHHADDREQLAAGGLDDLRIDTGGLETRIMGVLSGGTFRPQALVGRRA